MTAALELLFEFGLSAFSAGFVVFLRVGAVMALLPAFGERSVPERVRLALAIAFTIIVAPAVSPNFDSLPSFNTGMLRIFLSEAVVGLALGMTIRLFVLALQVAGAIAAQSTSLSQILGTAGVEPLPAIGHVLVIGGLALAVMSGLHVRVAEALIASYTVFPLGQFPTASILTDWGVAHVAQAFGLAFTLAAPFVIASFIYNLALGVINKAMPQLMVAFVGAPAITGGGLVLLFLSAPLLLSFWRSELVLFLDNPFTVPK